MSDRYYTKAQLDQMLERLTEAGAISLSQLRRLIGEHSLLRSHLKDTKKRSKKLEAALQRVVDSCDLPNSAYGILERVAINKACELLEKE